jgi:hypothetical protein
VATSGDCGWIASSNVAWITVGAGSGAGSDVIPFVVRDNLTGQPRSGTIHVGGQTFTVVQSAAVECGFEINPSFQNFSAAGGAGSFNIICGAQCAWQATESKGSWITITSERVGIGAATVTFTVSANATGQTRKGTITIANRVFALKQKG